MRNREGYVRPLAQGHLDPMVALRKGGPGHHGDADAQRGKGRQQVHNTVLRTCVCGRAISALFEPL